MATPSTCRLGHSSARKPLKPAWGSWASQALAGCEDKAPLGVQVDKDPQPKTNITVFKTHFKTFWGPLLAPNKKEESGLGPEQTWSIFSPLRKFSPSIGLSLKLADLRRVPKPALPSFLFFAFFEEGYYPKCLISFFLDLHFLSK